MSTQLARRLAATVLAFSLTVGAGSAGAAPSLSASRESSLFSALWGRVVGFWGLLPERVQQIGQKHDRGPRPEAAPPGAAGPASGSTGTPDLTDDTDDGAMGDPLG